MPANLTPQYHKAEAEYRQASTPEEELRCLELMLREMPKHKGTDKLQAELKQKISKAKSINAVTDLMLHADTQRALNDLPEGIRDEVRDFAKARLVELGWPARKVA